MGAFETSRPIITGLAEREKKYKDMIWKKRGTDGEGRRSGKGPVKTCCWAQTCTQADIRFANHVVVSGWGDSPAGVGVGFSGRKLGRGPHEVGCRLIARQRTEAF